MANLVKRNNKAEAAEVGPTQPRIIANRYRLGQQIGKGGNARVYYADDLKQNSPVALKLFFRELERDPYFVARFRKEVRIASKLQHHNIVRTLDYGYEAGRYFLVMDLVDGSNLQDIINRCGPLGINEVVNLLEQLCDALQYAHSQGIIHRDIKPHNVLVDRQGMVRLGDFGLARAIANTGLSVTGPTLGTISYLAPEQIQNGPLTARTDIYALGVMMFEMVTGRLPFENPSALAVALAHVTQEPPLPRIHNPQVSPSLELLIRRCMAKDPERRPSSVIELKANLLHCLTDEFGYQTQPGAAKDEIQPGTSEPSVEQAARNNLADVISISLPTWMLQKLEHSGQADQFGLNEPATLPIRARLDQEKTDPAITAFSDFSEEDDEPLDSITPMIKGTTGWTNTRIFRNKPRKQRWAIVVLIALSLLGLGLAATLGFNLVQQARQQSGATATLPTVTAVSTTATAATTTPATKTPVPATAKPSIATSDGLRVGGTLLGVNIWRAQDGPILISEDVIVGAGASLTIEPGVTIKLSNGTNLRIEGGKVEAVGSASLPILFTSTASQPQAGDWGGIIVNKNGTLILSQVDLRYGGSDKAPISDPKHPALLVTDSRLEMTASSVTQSAGAGLIILGKSSGFVTRSAFNNNADYQVYLDSKGFSFTGNQVTGSKVKL